MAIKKQHALIWLGILISVLLLWVSLRNTDLDQIISALSNSNILYAPLFIITLFSYYWLKAQRWALILNSITKTSARELYPPMMIGYAGSLILPLQLGELVRVYLTSSKLSLRKTPVLTSIILEKLFDFLTLFLIISVISFYLENISSMLSNTFLIAGIFAFLLFVTMFFYVYFTNLFITVITVPLRLFPEKIKNIIIDNIKHGATSLNSVKDARKISALLFLSILQWCLMGLCIYISIAAIGVNISIAVAFLVLVLIIVSVTLPTSPGYIGSIQAAYYFALTPFNISPNEALVSSVFYHVISYISVLLVGIYYLRKYKISYLDLKSNITK